MNYPYTLSNLSFRLILLCTFVFGPALCADLAFEYNAAEDTGGNSTWSDEVGSTDLTFQGSSGAVNTTQTATPGTYFSSAYAFGDTVEYADVGNGWQDLGKTFTNPGASYELWLKADAVNATQKQVLITLGGSAKGFSLHLDTDGSLLAMSKNNDQGNPFIYLSSTDVSTLITGSQFVQVVYVQELSGGSMTGNIYVNGVLNATETVEESYEYDGGANGALGGFDGSTIGALNPTSNTLGPGGSTLGFDDFTGLSGQIALTRLYDTALSATDVQNAYNAIVIPEPSTYAVLMACLAGAALFVRRRATRGRVR